MPRLDVVLPAARYPIHIGRGLDTTGLLERSLGDGAVVVVSDATVAALHGDTLLAALAAHRPRLLVRPVGEQHKTLAAAAELYDALATAGCGRDTTLIALGGGVVGDLTGFVAATWQRGLRWIQVPTTLLAMVDAAVGGKTAVNHAHGKNLIGAFHQPAAVLADLARLDTLPEREYRAGLAEVLKYGLALDADLLTWLSAHWDALIARDDAALEHAVWQCCSLKAAVVAADEREQGERVLLNLGHSFGHALETRLGHGHWLHGEAVAVGLVMEMRLAVALDLADASQLTDLEALLRRAGLPTAPPPDIDLAALLPALRRDKKNRAARPRLVLPTRHGRAVLHQPDSEAALAAAFATSAERRAHG